MRNLIENRELYKINSKVSNHLSIRLRSREILKEANKFDKLVYQIDCDGKIIKKYNDVFEIALFLKLDRLDVLDILKNQKIYNNTLFVYVKHYKTTINYNILIKYLKFKKNLYN